MSQILPIPDGLAERAAQLGDADVVLTGAQIDAFVAEQVGRADVDGKRVVVVVPDGTRSGPHAAMWWRTYEALTGRAASITVLIALGTHEEMSEEQISKLLGYEPGAFAQTFPGATVVNHHWNDPDAIADLGEIEAEEITRLSGGLLQDTPMRVQVNRLVAEADVNLVIGPVFPHEVVGFSGGNKYFYPGCSVHDVIDISHWVGALITASRIIGSLGITPVRQLIDAATARIGGEKLALTYVVTDATDVHSVAFGDTQASWAASAKVSALTHITYVEKPYRRIISMIPEMYEDFWTGAKGFYKLEPACADGGEIILYAPHITEVSHMHPGLKEIGYHNIEYFTKQWDRFGSHPWGELAHSTHVTGLGTYDPETGEEKQRVRVVFASQIPPEVCAEYNVGYMNPDDVDFAVAESDPDTLVVPHAGEILHRPASERPDAAPSGAGPAGSGPSGAGPAGSAPSGVAPVGQGEPDGQREPEDDAMTQPGG